ncbi:Flp pilus assembly complex ATPase component TadA [bacterium]|nr:Flp pilus assembly complex ATPase component TadA [bacterium]
MFRKARLGDVLLKSGLISQTKLDEVLEIQKKKGGRLGELLVTEGAVREEDMLKAIAEMVGVPFVKLKHYAIDPTAAEMLSEETCRKFNVVPLSCVGQSLVVAVDDPFDLDQIDSLGKLTSLNVTPVVSTRAEIKKTIDLLFSKKDAAPMEQELYLVSRAGDVVPLVSEGPETPADLLLEKLIRQALQEGAQALIMEPRRAYLQIKFRIDGFLYDRTHVPVQQYQAMVSKLRDLSNREQLVMATPFDESFVVRLSFGEERLEIRVGLLETVLGTKAVLHIQRRNMYLRDLSDLGFELEAFEIFEKLVTAPEGLILICGSTHSGKTTTAYSIAHFLQKTENRFVMSIEAPMGLLVESFNQLHPTKNPDFENADSIVLRALRQDPDVLLIDRLASMDSVPQALFAAAIGKLVLCTYFAETAFDALLHLLENPKLDRYIFATQTLGIIAQRLVRRICGRCATVYHPTLEELQTLDMLEYKDYDFYRGAGCDACFGTGYRGQTGIFQALLFNRELTELVSRRAGVKELLESVERTGIKTLRSRGKKKILSGITTIDEVLRETYGEERLYGGPKTV